MSSCLWIGSYPDGALRPASGGRAGPGPHVRESLAKLPAADWLADALDGLRPGLACGLLAARGGGSSERGGGPLRINGFVRPAKQANNIEVIQSGTSVVFEICFSVNSGWTLGRCI